MRIVIEKANLRFSKSQFDIMDNYKLRFENLKFAFPITMGMGGSFKALHDIGLCGVL